MVNLPIDQLQDHPKQSEFFKPLDGKAWEEFYTDINTRGIQQPIIISDRTDGWVIADGHQRVRAAKHLGWLEVPCVVGEFASELEEVRCLVMNNVQRRQLSREELDNVIRYWLANYTGHSNKRIADEIGVSDHTVEAKRQEMESTSQIAKLDKLEGRDGKLRPRTQSKREPDAVLYPKSGKPVTAKETQLAGSDNLPQLEVIQSTENLPQPSPPGWAPTATRKELERVAKILTTLDADECREEITRDALGTLRPYLMSAQKQLTNMLETQRGPADDYPSTITVRN